MAGFLLVKLILTDVDDVLLDWCTSFTAFMAEQDIHPVNHEEDSLATIFDMHDTHMSFYVREFNASDHFRNMKPYKGAHHVVTRLAAEGHRFHAITSCGTDADVTHARFQNLRSVFGDVFDRITMIPLQKCKRDHLAQYENSGLYWLEDNVRNAKIGQELGLQSILLLKPWNQKGAADFDGPKINSWFDFHSMMHRAPDAHILA